MRKAVAVAAIMLALSGHSLTQDQSDQTECTQDEKISMLYSPPLDPVLAVTRNFRKSLLHESGAVPPTDYRTYALLRVEIGNDGLPKFVNFFVSTGNRPVDKALQQWAMGAKFSPDLCPLPRTRIGSVAIDLRQA